MMSYIDDPKTKEDLLAKYKQRFDRMDSQRNYYENDWAITDPQVRADTYYDNQGRLQVNVPLEQNYIEIYLGKMANKLVYDVEPYDEDDVDRTQPAKYVLDHFLDMENFYGELRKFDHLKCKYGTGILYCGIRHEVDKRYEIKEGTELDNNGYYDDTHYNEFESEKRYFTPKAIHPREFWIDEKVTETNYWDRAEDCIMQEVMSIDEVKTRRGNQTSFNQKEVQGIKPYMNRDPQSNRNPYTYDKAIIHYYFNRITKDYLIVANYNQLLYAGKMLYKHGKLPFAIAQHYPQTNSMYGMSLPTKLRYIKLYKSNMLQNALDKTNMASGINIGLGGGGEVDGDLYTSGGEINIWRFTNGLDNVKQFQLDGNINGQVAMMNIIDDLVIQDTGDNIKAPYTSPATTAFEVGVMEEKSAERSQSVDVLRNMCLDYALSLTLSNISQFAPTLLSKTTTMERKGKKQLEKVEFPMIKVPNVSVKKSKKKGEFEFEDDRGKYGFFELKEDTIKGEMKVRVVTPSTRTGLKSIEKNSITQMINNKLALANLTAAGVNPDEVKELDEYMQLVYGYDERINATTKRDDIKQKNLEAIQQLKEMAGIPTLEGKLKDAQNNPEIPGLGQAAGGQAPQAAPSTGNTGFGGF